MFLNVFLRHFITTFLDIQVDRLRILNEKENTSPHLDKEDCEIICYVVGYIGKRVRQKPSCYSEELSEMLVLDKPSDGVPCKWIQVQTRGGLLYPTVKFYAFLIQCEKVLLGYVDINNVSSNSLLKA